MPTIKEYENYCESQYNFVKTTINRNLYEPRRVVANAIQRLVGVGVFVQQIGVTYEEAYKVLETYKEKLNNLLKTLDKSEVI
jgi:hypothetical protein